MKLRQFAYALIGGGILAVSACASGPGEPESKDCWDWMNDESLTAEQEEVVWNGCTFSTLEFEDQPVTYAEIEVMYQDFLADEECAFSYPVSAECEARLNHDLTLEEIREEGMAE